MKVELLIKTQHLCYNCSQQGQRGGLPRKLPFANILDICEGCGVQLVRARLPSISHILPKGFLDQSFKYPPTGSEAQIRPPYNERSDSFPTLYLDTGCATQWQSRSPVSSSGTMPWQVGSFRDTLSSNASSQQPMPSPSWTGSRSPSACSGDVTSEHPYRSNFRGTKRRCLTPTTVDDDNVFQRASKFVHYPADVSPPRDQGWYQPQDPGNRYSLRLREKLASLGKLTIQDLIVEYFRRNPDQKVYGEGITKPRKADKKNALLTEDASPDSSTWEVATSKSHRDKEEDRRNRHRGYQADSHRRDPDIVVKLGYDQAGEDSKTKSQEGKGPGKDEQLCSSVFAKEFSGLVVQALHDRLMEAEQHIQDLLAASQPYNQPSEYVGFKRHRHDAD